MNDEMGEVGCFGVDEDDPNAASDRQATLKRVEASIRRHCNCELFLMLDGISILEDEATIRGEMVKLKKKLEEQSER